MDYTAFFTAISCLVALISIFVSLRSSIKQNKLQKENNCIQEKLVNIQEEYNRMSVIDKYLSWGDVEKFAKIIIQKMDNENFVPDFIYAPLKRDAIIASMVSQSFNEITPIFVGTIIHNSIESAFIESLKDKFFIKKISNRLSAHIFIPLKLPINNSNKVLIIRDYSGSGICFETVKTHLIEEYSLTNDNVKTACISYADTSREFLPNYWCLESNHVWFPWGKNI